MKSLNIGIQLYTVRDDTSKDFARTVDTIGKLGYAGVELAGFGNLSPAEAKKACDGAGLKIPSAHVMLDAFAGDLNKTLDTYESVGCKHLVVPWIGENLRSDAAAWRNFAATMTDLAKKIQPRGFTLGYHNHSFEFQKFDGVYGLDILWQHTDPNLVRAELDVFWVQHGNVDPTSYIKQLGKPRVQFVHLKDMDKADGNRFAPVGTGRLDFKSIVAAAVDAGALWGHVEQDDCYGAPPLEVAKVCIENLKKLGLA